jgi:ABC-type hemin transport system ATPase subunit
MLSFQPLLVVSLRTSPPARVCCVCRPAYPTPPTPPTSALTHPFQAERVVESLRTLAKEDGVTIVTVLHQPRGSIFGMLDDLILVAEGRTVYAGTAAEAAKYMESKVRGP